MYPCGLFGNSKSRSGSEVGMRKTSLWDIVVEGRANQYKRVGRWSGRMILESELPRERVKNQELWS